MKRPLLLLAAFLVLGCGSENSPTSTSSSGSAKPKSKIRRIAVVPKGTGHEFWKSVHSGAEKAAKEIGNVEIIWQAPAKEDDTNGQMEVVRGLVAKGVDAICLAPIDSQALKRVVREANSQKIPVVIFDSGLGEGPEIVSYVATDNKHGGELAADRLAEVLGKKGNVIMMRYREGSESTEQREVGFLESIAKYPDIKVLSSNQFGDSTPQTAMATGQQLLLQFRDQVNGIFAVCEPNCEGMLLALEKAELTGKVKFIAFDPSDALITALNKDFVHGIVLQDPVNMGYESVKAAIAHLEGKEVPKRVPTGEYVATPENKDTDDMKRLLHPSIID